MPVTALLRTWSAPTGSAWSRTTSRRTSRTSNTVAKCVWGISDTLATNVFAQAGKCRVPSIVFACDTAPELLTMAPDGPVKVYPRPIDLENTGRLKAFERTEVVESLAGLEAAIRRRRAELGDDG